MRAKPHPVRVVERVVKMTAKTLRQLILLQALAAAGLLSTAGADTTTVVTQPGSVSQTTSTSTTTTTWQPYTIEEEGTKLQIDPEDYYYVQDGVTYHHVYNADRDIVVQEVPREYRVVHHKIDLTVIPEKHFRHPRMVVRPSTDYEPYTIEEEGTKLQIDPEDYYYVVDGVTYHHMYNGERDVVVNEVPKNYQVIHRRIDVSTLPPKYLHHGPVTEVKKETKTEVHEEHSETHVEH